MEAVNRVQNNYKAVKINNYPLKHDKWYGLAFVSPMVLGYMIFVLVPIIAIFAISLTDWSLIDAPKFLGMENYVKMFTKDPTFYATALNTFNFTLWLVPLNIILTLALAMLLKDSVPGVGIFRTAVFTPVMTSIVVWAVVWKYIFQTDNGVINVLLKQIGIQGPQWLFDIKLAIPVVVVVTLLKGFGMNMVIFISALKEVPEMYYEAARIDGAKKWQIFRNITLPMISPTIFMVTIITIIGSLKVFGQIYIMTEGGPGTSTFVFVYYIYQKAFKHYELGYASAISVVLFLIILAITLIQWFGRKRWVFHEQ